MPVAICASLLIASTFFFLLNLFQPAQIIPCTNVWADHLILALIITLFLQIFLYPIILHRRYKSFLAVHAFLVLLVIWLGLYPISPLGYSSGRIPNLRGFLMTTANRDTTIANKGIISLQQGSTVIVSPLMLAGKFQCDWMSVADGALDSPTSCNMIYVVPNADFDILRVRIRSACGLPDSIGQIKVSILP
jgi:hypothetical protein